MSGILYAPNTIDSTVYHLTRIEFWLQHKNVNYFATQTDRMLYQPPLAEYMILQFRLLKDSDTFSFIIQWLFAIGACLGVSLLAEIAGANKKVQQLSLFIAGTIPMLILQSSSTQNDVVVAFFIIMTALHLLKNLKENKSTSAFLSGISIGEAILTKGTAYVFLFPICMFWGIMKLIKIYNKEVKFIQQLKFLMLLVIPFLTICLSFYYRNYVLIGSPLGVSKELFYVYNNQSHTISSFLSVVFRNLSLHFTFPGIHLIAEKIIYFLHQSILNVSVNDPATSFCPFDLPMLGMTEDNAGNLLHILLIIPALTFVFKSRNTTLKAITFFGIFSFLLFCFQIKWQLWHSRLHIPVFLLMSIPIAFFIEQYKFSKPIVLLIGISAITFSLFCFNRPIIKFPPLTSNVYFSESRIAQFYTMQEEKGNQMQAVIKYLQKKNFKTIAVKSEEKYGNDILYPIMYNLRHKSKFYPVQMFNQTKSLDSTNMNFDAVLFFTSTPPDTLKIVNNYKKNVINSSDLFIFTPLKNINKH
ncbi:ArnT family glycosyltransferase [Emticicia aquatica]|uniref:ArnT family glycosyltransferase n=1 Tax=Emticicia aquatica TaxID=1681835 RepID=UPI001EEC1806|nr:glycosyltransferase family 39 protein [Emticicia aquatica]